MDSLSVRRSRAIASLKRLSKLYSASLTHLGRVGDTAKKERVDDNLKAYRILIGTILSHRTKDERTEIATDALISKYPTPQKLASASLASIQKLIKPVGFYRSKAKYVKKCSQELLERFNGVVPRTMHELTSLTGVGRKTAGCVMVYAHELPAIPVDSHVHEVSNRLGLVQTKTPEKTEQALMALLPEKDWLAVNELFVIHGQKTCVPVSPFCRRCPLAKGCPKKGVGHSR